MASLLPSASEKRSRSNMVSESLPAVHKHSLAHSKKNFQLWHTSAFPRTLKDRGQERNKLCRQISNAKLYIYLTGVTSHILQECILYMLSNYFNRGINRCLHCEETCMVIASWSNFFSWYDVAAARRWSSGATWNKERTIKRQNWQAWMTNLTTVIIRLIHKYQWHPV